MDNNESNLTNPKNSNIDIQTKLFKNIHEELFVLDKEKTNYILSFFIISFTMCITYLLNDFNYKAHDRLFYSVLSIGIAIVFILL